MNLFNTLTSHGYETTFLLIFVQIAYSITMPALVHWHKEPYSPCKTSFKNLSQLIGCVCELFFKYSLNECTPWTKTIAQDMNLYFLNRLLLADCTQLVAGANEYFQSFLKMFRLDCKKKLMPDYVKKAEISLLQLISY